MRIDEVSGTLPRFQAVLRVGCFVTRMVIEADGLNQARAICSHLFGSANVQSISQMPSNLQEISADAPKISHVKPQSPAELRVKAMSDQAATLEKQSKRMKAQQGVQKAQERLRKAMQP